MLGLLINLLVSPVAADAVVLRDLHKAVIEVGLRNKAISSDFQIRIQVIGSRYIATLTNTPQREGMMAESALRVVLEGKTIKEVDAVPLHSGSLLTDQQGKAAGVALGRAADLGRNLSGIHIHCNTTLLGYHVYFSEFPATHLNRDFSMDLGKDFTVRKTRRGL